MRASGRSLYPSPSERSKVNCVRMGGRVGKRLAGRGGEKVETRTVIETDVEMKLRTILIRIHHVARAHSGTAEPANVSRRAVSRDNGDPGFLIRMPLIERAAALDHFHIGDEGEEREHRVIWRHGKIVDHCRPRHFEPDFIDHPAVAIERVEDDVFRAIAFGLIREGEHFVVNQVEFGMRAQAHAGDGSGEVAMSPRFQRLRIELVRQVVLFESE